MGQMAVIWYYILAFFSLSISAFSQILLKKSAGKKYGNIAREYLNKYVICAYMLYVAALFITTICYGGLKYEFIIILETLGYVFVMVLSRLLLEEKITKKKVIGMFFIITGIIIFGL